MDHPDEKHRGTLSRGLFVMLRIGELLSGVIVLSLTGRFFFLLDVGLGSPNARLIYTSVIASMTVVLSLLFMPPLPYAFWSFPIDMFMFAAWLVAFCLLETLTGINTCNSAWYRNYWGYYWGRWYTVGPAGINVNWAGCSSYRTILAFSFIASMLYLCSAILGMYWVGSYGRIRHHGRRLRSRPRHLLSRYRKPKRTEGGVVEASPSDAQAVPTSSGAVEPTTQPTGGTDDPVRGPAAV